MAIDSFRHKGLQELFETDDTKRIGKDIKTRCAAILELLEAAVSLGDLSGLRSFHALKGNRKGAYSMWVSGNWRITFGWHETNGAIAVDLEDYH